MIPPAQRVSATRTLYALICGSDGRVYLTHDEYTAQMEKANMRWICPVCGEVADFDDETYENGMDIAEAIHYGTWLGGEDTW